MSRLGRKDVRTRWEIELFPFSTIYPEERGGKSGTPEVIKVGIQNVRISRSKTTPTGNCSFMIVGKPPDSCFPGTWMIAATASFESAGKERKLSRFIGQIYDMTVDYVTIPDSGIVQARSTFFCREWSSMLEMPVRYDLNSIAQSQAKNSSTGGVSNFSISGAVKKSEMSNGKYVDIIEKSFSAYELTHLILKLIGAIGENDSINSIKALGDIKLSEVSLRMPSVPQSLLDRLNLKGAKANSPFTSGFCRIITGVQKNPVNNKGDFNGIWGRESPSVQSYADGMDKNPKDRPITLGLAPLASLGDSAWNLITQHCDPAINEFFTDMLYEQGTNPSDIVGRPVVFARDKPFLMKRFKDSVPTSLGSWTVYDNLPRIYIDNVYIDSFSIKNTILNSPNFIRMNFNPQTMKSEIGPAIAQLEQTQLAPEMDRFGGQEHFVETQFMPNSVKDGKPLDLKEWFKKIRSIAVFWHAYNYRMASGSIRLRDDNIPITVGMNVQFPMGEFQIVGHVESIEISGTVSENGQYQTSTTVQISRVVQSINGRLEFIAPNAMSNLMASKPKAVPDSAAFGDTLSSGLQSVAGAISKGIDAIKGILS